MVVVMMVIGLLTSCLDHSIIAVNEGGVGFEAALSSVVDALSWVISMNASSSEASCGASSSRAMWRTKAMSADLLSIEPSHGERPVGFLDNGRPLGVHGFTELIWLWRTDPHYACCRKLWAMNSSTGISAMSRPRPITTRWSAVRAISLMR